MNKLIRGFVRDFVTCLAILSITAFALALINHHVAQEVPGPGQMKFVPAATAQP